MAYFDPIPLRVVDGDTAKAADLNSMGTSLETSFGSVETDIINVNANAEAWAGVSQEWAEKLEDVEVVVGGYSSLHHSAKSLGHADDSNTARAASVVAKDASVTAQGLSETARDASVVAQGLSEGARDASIVAQGLSETARDTSLTHSNSSDTARAASVVAQGLSETARDASIVAQGLSEGARDTSLTHSDTSQLRAWDAEAEQMTANSYAVETTGTNVSTYTSDGDGTFTATVTADYSAKHYADNTSFPSGTSMAYFQAAAPTGWTQDITNTDAMLRVVSGAGGGNGGSDSAILNDKVPSHTHTTNTTGSHTHTNQGEGGGGIAGNTGYTARSGGYTTKTNLTNGLQANGNHSHTIDANAGASNWTPKYVDMIICVKD